MRVLYLSRSDAFDDTSSLVTIAKSFFRHMLEQDPEMYVTWVVPKGVKDEVLSQYVLADMPDPARLGFVKCMAGLGGRTLGYLMTEDVWYLLTQTKVEVPYDVVLSNQPALTGVWSTVLTNRYQASRYAVKTPIVNWQMWTATQQQMDEVPEYYAGEPDLMAESISSLYAMNVWESQILLDGHLETMKRWLKPSALRTIIDQSVVINNGVDWDRLNAAYERRVAGFAGREATLFWGGRLSNQKKPRVTFPLMQTVRNAARCPVIVSTNKVDGDPGVDWAKASFPDWSVMTGVNSKGFGEMMQKGDVFLCNSVSESYGVAWLEMLAMGMIGVFERVWWNEALLPDWYPFVTDSHDEQVAMATALLKQWPDGPLWKEYVPKIRQWIEHEHAEKVCAGALGALLRDQKAQSIAEQRITPTLADLAERAAHEVLAETGAPVREHEVWGRMTALSESNREFGKGGDLISRMYLRRLLEVRGWRDICRSREVEFVPPGGVG